MMREASHPKFSFVAFPKIRSADDFARGVLCNKRQVIQDQLRWQSTVVPNSLLEYSGPANKDLSKYAIYIHSNILGYTRDRFHSSPAVLAQGILAQGLRFPELVDEIYVQLCKHLTQNPRLESQVRGWRLMCICTDTFLPSQSFELYLLNFILGHNDDASTVGNYARYSLRRLEGAIQSGFGGRSIAPSVAEINAFHIEPPSAPATFSQVEAEQLRDESLHRANQPQYSFVKFPMIRLPDDLARGVLFNKLRVKDFQLRWQSTVIPNSLLDYDANKNMIKFATYIHSSILGYTRDRSDLSPAVLAQAILARGLRFPELVDEIYVQLCKHLTQNPRLESQVRGWRLMCICTDTFLPSQSFELYLLNFILGHKDDVEIIGDYARYSLRRLEGAIQSGFGGRSIAPSVADINAYDVQLPSVPVATLDCRVGGDVIATTPSAGAVITASSPATPSERLGRIPISTIVTGNPMTIAVASLRSA